MHARNRAIFIFSCALPCLYLAGGPAQSQTIQYTLREVALKSGESTELTDLYSINANCKSLLKATPQVEILDGPPGVTATVNAVKVVPRIFGCAKPVEGGKLVIAAKDIQDYSYTRMVLRVDFKTANGERQRSVNVNIALFPADDHQ